MVQNRIDVQTTLACSLPAELADALLSAQKEIEGSYVNRKWKASELDAGHFVEVTRRIIELRLFGAYTPIGKDLSKFNEKLLQQYEQASGDESYRILIPRVLRAIYGIRNKRGVGHLGVISPNEMDATLILYCIKWVLAEVLRLELGLNPADTQKAMEQVIERQTTLLWKEGEIVRVIDKTLMAREQILVLLYDESPQREEDLRSRCEYKNPTSFRKILKRLHADKLIFFDSDSSCVIMPGGIKTAERIALESA